MRSYLLPKFAHYLSLAALLLVVVSCANKTGEVEKACVSNADQSALFKGHWANRPVPLAVEAIDFSATEIVQLTSAITTWNNFFQESKGFKLFLSGSSPLGTVSTGGTRVTSATACAQSVVSGSGFSNSIKIYKNKTSWAYGTSVMALTSLCPIVIPSRTYREFVSAVMEINFVNYFVSGKPLPDLQSIVTHELGHMLGLDHSCSGTACANAPESYREAIMYPSLGFDGINGRVKRSVETNDQQRANCLY